MAINTNSKHSLEIKVKGVNEAQREVDKYKRTIQDLAYQEKLEKAAGDESKIAKINMQRALQQANSDLRKAKQAQQEYNKTLKQTSKTASEFTSTFKGMVVGFASTQGIISLATSSFNAAKQEIIDLIEVGRKWSGTVGSLGPQTQKLALATDNIISHTSLSRIAEFQKVLRLTDNQAQAIAKASVVSARLNKTSFDQAMTDITNTVVNFSDRGLKKLGLTIDLTGTKANKQAQIIKVLEERYGQLAISAENADEKQLKYINTLEAKKAVIGELIANSKVITFWQDREIRKYAIASEALKKVENGYEGIINRLQQLSSFNKDEVIKAVLGIGYESNVDFIKYLGSVGEQAKQVEEVLAKQSIKERDIQEMREKNTKQKPYTSQLKGSIFGDGVLSQKEQASRLSIEMKLIEEEQKLKDQQREKNIAALNKVAESERRLNEQRRARHQEEIKRIKQVNNERAQETAQLVGGIIQSTAAQLAYAQTAQEAGKAVLSSVVSTITGQAWLSMTREIALALGAQGITWGIPNPASMNHWAAAAMWGVIGGAGTAASVGINSIGSSSGIQGTSNYGSGSTGFSDNTPSSSSSSSEPKDTRPVVNIVLNNRYGVINRKSLKKMAREHNNGNIV